MGIQVALNHRTHYRYEKAISLGPQVIQLRPALHCRTPILSYSLDVTPSEHILNWQLDPHNNRLARLLFSEKTSEFLVEVNLVADLSPYNPFEFFLEPGVEEYPFAYAPELAKDLEPYRIVDPPGPLLQAFLESFVGRKSGTISLLLDLNRKVRDEIGYVDAPRAGRPDVRRDPREALGVVPRLCMAAGSESQKSWNRGTVCLGVSDSIAVRRPGVGRSGQRRFSRSACLGRGVLAWRGLDWNGSDLGPARRRGSHPAGLHSDCFASRADWRHFGAGQQWNSATPFRFAV